MSGATTIDRKSVLVPGVSVGDVVDALNASGSGFGHRLDPATWKKQPESQILSKGKGFCSDIYSVRFHTPEGVASVVVKVPTARLYQTTEMSPQELEDVARDMSKLHQNELTMYRLFNRWGYGDLKLLRFYGGREWMPEKPGFMLLEDVSGRVCSKKFTGVMTYTDAQVREAIVEIAKMQAIGFRFPKEDTTDLGTGAAMTANWLVMVDEMVAKMEREQFPFLTETRVQELRKLSDKQALTQVIKAHETEGLPAVLVHDDYWVSNILLTNEGHVDTVLDWQCAFFASFGLDMALLFATVLQGEQRRAKEDEYLQFYIEQLRVQLKHFGITNTGGMENISLDTVRRVYKKALRNALLEIMFSYVQYNARNPGVDGSESPLTNRFRCCVEDLWP